MFLVGIGIVIGMVLAIAIMLALFIVSGETEEGDEWKWR